MSDQLALADWLELEAICAGDKNSSLGDLERALERDPEFDDDREGVENKLADVAKELEFRRVAADAGYPFSLEDGVLTYGGDTRSSTYVFCLCLSYLPTKKQLAVFPARMFEVVAAEAARNYLTGVNWSAASVRFGAPRTPPEIPKSFRGAVDKLCKELLKEGGGWPKARKVGSEQDAGLDVAAWRSWRDEFPGRLIIFGACATGNDWTDKTHDIIPGEFCNAFMDEQPASAILRGFFVPHRLDRTEWTHLTREAGIVFDRCRIALLVNALPADTNRHGDPGTWLDNLIQSMAS